MFWIYILILEISYITVSNCENQYTDADNCTCTWDSTVNDCACCKSTGQQCTGINRNKCTLSGDTFGCDYHDFNCGTGIMLDREPEVVMRPRGLTWTTNHCCQLVWYKHKSQNEMYTFSLSVKALSAIYLGSNSAHPGLLFNWQNERNYEIFYTRPHKPAQCITHIAIVSGVKKDEQTPRTECTRLQNLNKVAKFDEWFTLKIIFGQTNVTAYINEEFLATWVPYFNGGRLGGAIPNGYNDRIHYKDFYFNYLCPIPTHLTNMKLIGDNVEFYKNGSIVQFRCVVGYEQSNEGLLQRTCDSGQWSDPTANCTVIQCPEVTFPPYVITSLVSWTFNSVIRFKCKDGYQWVSGDFMIACSATKEWIGTIPNCSLIECSDPVIFPNTLLTVSGRSYMDNITYLCDTGYNYVSGSLQRFCDVNGQWNGTVPVCEAIECPSPPNTTHMEAIVSRGTYHYGTVINYRCVHGFETVGDTWLQRNCSADGTWTSVTGSCRAKVQPYESCTSPPYLQRADIEQYKRSYGSGETVTYKCLDGYQEKGGPLMSRCMSNDRWSEVEGNCSAVTCDILPSPLNSHLMNESTKYPFTSIIWFECVHGHELVSGGITLICSTDGQWKGSPPVCKDISCGDPAVVEHASVIYTSTGYQSVAVYTCDDNYNHTEGNIARSCLANKKWSGTAPTCQGCGEPPSVKNADWKLNSRIRPLKAVYVCRAGFVHKDGLMEKTCQPDFSWSTNEPNCIANITITAINVPTSSNTIVSLQQQIMDAVGYTESDKILSHTVSGIGGICFIVAVGALLVFIDMPQLIAQFKKCRKRK